MIWIGTLMNNLWLLTLNANEKAKKNKNSNVLFWELESLFDFLREKRVISQSTKQ